MLPTVYYVKVATLNSKYKIHTYLENIRILSLFLTNSYKSDTKCYESSAYRHQDQDLVLVLKKVKFRVVCWSSSIPKKRRNM